MARIITFGEIMMRLNPEVCSLDAPAGEEEDGTLQLLLEVQLQLTVKV